MALTFGSGEQVDRLRRGLDIKGRVVLGVDEIVVPTVNVGDFTGPPIRKSGIRWYAPAFVPAVVGERGRYRIFHNNAVDQLVDRFYMQAVSAMDMLIGGGAVGAAAGATAAFTTELVRLPLQGGAGGGAIGRNIGIFTLVDSNVGPTVTQQFMRPQIQTLTLQLDVEIVLPAVRDPAAPNFSTLTLEANTPNVAFNVACSGLYFDTLPLNSLT